MAIELQLRNILAALSSGTGLPLSVYNIVSHVTYGNSAIKTAINGLNAILAHVTYGNQAIHVETLASKTVLEHANHGNAALLVEIQDIQDILGLTAGRVPGIAPSAADPTTLTGGAGAWASGAWAIVQADAPGDEKIESIRIHSLGIADEYELDLAVGAPGAEVVIGSWKFNNEDRIPVSASCMSPIAVGSAVSARCRNKAGGAVTCSISFNYYEV